MSEGFSFHRLLSLAPLPAPRPRPARRDRPGRSRGRARALSLELLEGRVVQSTIPVTSPSDSGAGTLRAAIIQADGDTTPDTITFSVTGTITLESALPGLTGNISVSGPGAGSLTVARDGAGAAAPFGIFNVPSGANVAISGLTLQGGDSGSGDGGGIDNAGTLTVTNTTFNNTLAITTLATSLAL